MTEVCLIYVTVEDFYNTIYQVKNNNNNRSEKIKEMIDFTLSKARRNTVQGPSLSSSLSAIRYIYKQFLNKLEIPHPCPYFPSSLFSLVSGFRAFPSQETGTEIWSKEGSNHSLHQIEFDLIQAPNPMHFDSHPFSILQCLPKARETKETKTF